MTRLSSRGFPTLFCSIAAAWTAAVSVSVPVPVQAETSAMQRNMYGPTAAEILAAYLEDQEYERQPSTNDLAERIGNRRNRLHDSARGRTLDNVRGISFASGRIEPASNGRIRFSPAERFAAKRNIDEIDRSPFDNFFKKTAGRLDRFGWIDLVNGPSDDDYPSFDRSRATLDR